MTDIGEKTKKETFTEEHTIVNCLDDEHETLYVEHLCPSVCFSLSAHTHTPEYKFM